MGFFRTKAAKAKIDRSTEQVLELEAQKKRLEIDRDQINLELQNTKRKMEMSLEEEQHKHRMKLESEKAVFSREKEIWTKEKQELQDRAARERKEFEETLKKQHDIQLQEALTLTKLDSQQKVKQAELDKDRAVSKLEAEYSTKLSAARAEAAEEYYTKLTGAFQELQINGDKNSKFVQELTLKMIESMPRPKTSVDVEVSTPQLAYSKAE